MGDGGILQDSDDMSIGEPTTAPVAMDTPPRLRSRVAEMIDICRATREESSMPTYPTEDFTLLPEDDRHTHFSLDYTGDNKDLLNTLLMDNVCPAHVDDMMVIVRALRVKQERKAGLVNFHGPSSSSSSPWPSPSSSSSAAAGVSHYPDGGSSSSSASPIKKRKAMYSVLV